MRMKRTFALPLLSGAMMLLACSTLIAARSHAGHRQASGQAAGGGQALCELCSKPIARQTAVVLEAVADHSKHHYACIHCALVGARDWVKGDVGVSVKSEVGRRELRWDRRNGKWSVSPSSAVVLSAPEAGGDCRQEHIAFSDEGEYRSYASSHPAASGRKPIAGAQVDAILEAGKPVAPREAVCPVSGKSFHPKAGTEWTVYKGQTYYFCCTQCKPRFVSSPESYVGGQASGSGEKSEHGGCSGMSGGSCGGQGSASCDHGEAEAGKAGSGHQH